MFKKVFVICLFVFFIPIFSNSLEKALIQSFRKGEFKKAKKILEKKMLNDEYRLLFKGELAAYNGDYEMAKNNFKKVIKRTKKKNKFHIIAKYLIDVMYLNKGFKRYLNELNARYRELLKKGDKINAYYVVEKLCKLDPLNPEYQLKLAQSGIMINAPQVSYVASKKVLDLQPVDKKIYYNGVITLSISLRDFYDMNHLDLDHAIDPEGLIRLLSSNGKNMLSSIIGTADLNNAIYELGKILKSKDAPENIKRQANSLMKYLMDKIELVEELERKRRI